MLTVNADINTIEVVIGPAICGDCYSIPRDRYEMFATEFAPCFADETGKNPHYSPEATVKNSSEITVDLQSLNIWQLEQIGITPEHIIRSQTCTQEDEDMYSFRGDTREEFGEIVSYVMLQ
jgi:copper oxidase (laccase) domain-containing protein